MDKLAVAYLESIGSSAPKIELKKLTREEYSRAARSWKKTLANSRLSYSRDIRKWTADGSWERYVLLEDGIAKGIAILDLKHVVDSGVLYVCRIAAFEEHRGYGKKLLDLSFDLPGVKMMYLMAERESGDMLQQFYRNYGMYEHVSRSGTHWFFKTKDPEGYEEALKYVQDHTF